MLKSLNLAYRMLFPTPRIGSRRWDLCACVKTGQFEMLYMYLRQLHKADRYNAGWPCPSGVATLLEEADSWASQISIEASVRQMNTVSWDLRANCPPSLLPKHSSLCYSRCLKVAETLRLVDMAVNPRSLLECQQDAYSISNDTWCLCLGSWITLEVTLLVSWIILCASLTRLPLGVIRASTCT